MRRRIPVLLSVFLWASSLSGASLFSLTLPWNDGSDNALSFAGLNDHVAGSRGPLTVGGDGHLYAGGQRIRFWGANLSGPGNFPISAADADAFAGRLAKFGFNMVRWHHMDNGWGGATIWQDYNNDRVLSPVSLGRMDELFASLKQRGIYSNINLVVSRPMHPGADLDPSLSAISDSKVRHAVGFFDPAQQQLQKDFARDLLTHVNPHTGLSYAQDPAVAFVEVNNENGLVQAWLSGQLDALPSYYDSLLKTRWNQWLVLKYGAQPMLESAWGVANVPLGAEKLTNGGFAAVIAPWNLEQNGAPPAVAAASVQPDGAGGTNVARLVISGTGQAGWHVQFNQSGLSVTAGAPYTLRFWARASANRSISVTLGRAHTDYIALGFDTSLNLTTSWQQFSFVFAPNVTEANARINFGNMGLATGTVWIGDVSFKPGGQLGLYPGEDIGGAGIRNFVYGGESVARSTEGRRDWFRFLLATEEAYWLDLRDYLKNTLNVQALLMGTIQGCSTPNLQAAFDGLDSHYYWKHPAFPGTAWDNLNWYVDNQAMPDDPAGSAPASIGVQAAYGKPHSVTELNAPFPSTFEADIQLLTAAYGGLQDWDAIYPFAIWDEEDGLSSTNLNEYFTIGNNPVKMAGMPSAAAAFRRGDFSPAAQLVAVPMSRADEVEQLLSASAWSLVHAGTAGEDRRAALKHRVRMILDGQSAPGGALGAGTSGPYGAAIASDTGQLNWLTGGVGGLVTGDSARTQFAAGFLGGRTVSLSSLDVSAVDSLQAGDYALLALSSKDGLPLTATASALLTVLGAQRNTGSTYYQYPATPLAWPPAKGLAITLRDQRGTGPVLVEGVSATVRLNYAPADVQVFALLPDGSRGASLPVGNAGGWAEVLVGPAYQSLLYEVAINRPAYSPTPTRTRTPVVTATPSRTLTPTPSQTPIPSQVLWEDMETGATPQNWQAYIDTSTGSILSVDQLTGTAAALGNYAHGVRFNSGSAGNWGGAFLINSSYGTKPSLGWRDLRGMSSVALRLWTDRPGLRVRVTVSEAGNTTTAVNGADGEIWESASGAWTTLGGAGWESFEFPLAAFRDKPGFPYNPTSIGNDTMDLDAISWVSLEWEGNQGADIRLRVDQVVFNRDLGTPSASATATRTGTLGAGSPSVTPSATMTPTRTPIFSATTSPTQSQSHTGTPVFSAIPSATLTESLSSTRTPTSTATPSSSLTLTPSPTPSPSETAAAPSPSFTPSPALDPGGALKVLEQGFAPLPLRGSSARLYFKLQGGAAALRWRVYSPAAVLLSEQVLTGPFGAGWGSARVPIVDLPSGPSYSVLEARRGGEASARHKVRIYVLR